MYLVFIALTILSFSLLIYLLYDCYRAAKEEASKRADRNKKILYYPQLILEFVIAFFSMRFFKIVGVCILIYFFFGLAMTSYTVS
jgi:threonine/homoserine/homoserine lactone efflux protein